MPIGTSSNRKSREASAGAAVDWRRTSKIHTITNDELWKRHKTNRRPRHVSKSAIRITQTGRTRSQYAHAALPPGRRTSSGHSNPQ